jgi:hypothetical protein
MAVALIGNVTSDVADPFVTLDVSAVPEQCTWAMTLLGFCGLAFAFRQSRRENNKCLFGTVKGG